MKLRFCIILLVLIFTTVVSHAQTINWEKNFGTNVFGSSVQALSDGYIALGGSLNFPNYTGYIVRTDLQGNKSWEKSYGDGSNPIIPSSIAKTSDGGFVFVGDNNSHPYM